MSPKGKRNPSQPDRSSPANRGGGGVSSRSCHGRPLPMTLPSELDLNLSQHLNKLLKGWSAPNVSEVKII